MTDQDRSTGSATKGGGVSDRMTGYEPHPVAEIFPMMSATDYARFRDDIAARGLLEPIWLHENKILDGRNRYKACLETDTRPEFVVYEGDDPIGFAISLNLHRRHLDAGQRAMVATEVETALAEQAKKRQAQNAKINQPQSQNKEKFPSSEKAQARDQAGALLGVSGRYVSDAKRVKERSPELAERVLSGDTTLQQAKRAIREQERERRRQENAAVVAGVPDPSKMLGSARFSTILIDPPWDWGDEGDVNQMGRAKPDYSTMPLESIKRLPVADLADTDCHIYLWITNRSLPKGFDLLSAWGFRYITCVTWVKPHFGLGNYFRGQTEHLLFGVKGSQSLKRRDAGTVLCAPRGKGHSAKPEAAYDLIESCSPGPYLEMFSRSERGLWTHWGQDSG